MSNDSFLPKGGGYRNLRAYKVATIIYDLTFYFTQTYLSGRDRTVDQMVQAARSGKQNIVEGSLASRTSKETEIKLTNVAYASLGELLDDYTDYLRVRDLPVWNDTHPRFAKMKLYAQSTEFEAGYREVIKIFDDEVLANLCVTLINQCQFLLGRLIKAQERQFIENGGVKEAMYRARVSRRMIPSEE